MQNEAWNLGDEQNLLPDQPEGLNANVDAQYSLCKSYIMMSKLLNK